MQWQAVLFYKQRFSCITREMKYLIKIPGAVIVQNNTNILYLIQENAVVLISGFVVHMNYISQFCLLQYTRAGLVQSSRLNV